MKTIIAGSRSIVEYSMVRAAIRASGFSQRITEVVSGAAIGVDKSGKIWARMNSIQCRQFPANWVHLDKGDGAIRNNEMAEYADILIAVWDGVSHGTAHMIKTMRKLGKPVFTYKPSPNGVSMTWSEGCPRVCQASQNGMREPEDCGASCTDTECRIQ